MEENSKGPFYLIENLNSSGFQPNLTWRFQLLKGRNAWDSKCIFNIYGESEQFKNNSKFIFIDFNGEYSNTITNEKNVIRNKNFTKDS